MDQAVGKRMNLMEAKGWSKTQFWMCLISEVDEKSRWRGWAELDKRLYRYGETSGFEISIEGTVTMVMDFKASRLEEIIRGMNVNSGSANCGPQAKSNQLPEFVNKILLEHCHIHLFIYCFWLFSCYHGRVEQLPQRSPSLLSPSFKIRQSLEWLWRKETQQLIQWCWNV